MTASPHPANPTARSPMPREPAPRRCFILEGEWKGPRAGEADPSYPAEASRCQRVAKSWNISRNGESVGKYTARTADPEKSEQARTLTSILRSAGAVSLSTGLAAATKFRALPILPPLAVASGGVRRGGPIRSSTASPGVAMILWGMAQQLLPIYPPLILFGTDWLEGWALQARVGRVVFRAARHVPGRMPEAAGRGIVKAIIRERDVAYVPGFWRPWMLTIRVIPERVFQRTRF